MDPAKAFADILLQRNTGRVVKRSQLHIRLYYTSLIKVGASIRPCKCFFSMCKVLSRTVFMLIGPRKRTLLLYRGFFIIRAMETWLIIIPWIYYYYSFFNIRAHQSHIKSMDFRFQKLLARIRTKTCGSIGIGVLSFFLFLFLSLLFILRDVNRHQPLPGHGYRLSSWILHWGR